MEKHIIWQDAVYEDEEKWKESYMEYLDSNGFSEAEVSIDDFIFESVYTFYEDQRTNLCKRTPEGIIVLADLGLWDGRRSTTSNKEYHYLNVCLNRYCNYAYLKVYVDEEDELVAEESHHDGANFVTYRKWKEGVSDDEKEELKDALYYGYESANGLIEKYTDKLGPDVRKIFGW